jgi:transcriptional regulator with XRE-family HTH domain
MDLQEERTSRGMSQRQLAAASGVSLQEISRIENGHTHIREGAREKLNKALGIEEKKD